MSDVRYHTMPDGLRIAFRLLEGRGPTLVFLPGYMSDMSGGKASALFEWARGRGQACLLLDYSGCGMSDGQFADGTLSNWRDEVLALVDAYCEGPVIVIGSSMGGWLNLMVGLALGERLAGLVGIASAPDFTDWGRTDAEKAKLAAGETVFEDNPYGAESTPFHPGFWADGEASKLLEGEIALTCPVRLIHGQRDADVPWQISLRLAEALESRDVVVTLVKDGDHRLSREQDINRLLHIVGEVA
ncbi:alpha/beta fold hydrolase [Erythrobacter litoralis]|uniref:Palmitoyl-protein thioesterase ABHD10, mitochondrial n=1 Tax=Erythrobacter litoralis (strain HTCC2594) TaxID=314225 RepID=Q2N6W9_ERYLH|nr:alpha/beta hydrolase [Erythrobacter litoralis]ABC64572.1 predicted hydrolase [Erythrobacter litoralis HTCC2594]